jgi:predicted enzyme related to lactoylglutathione lyase
MSRNTPNSSSLTPSAAAPSQRPAGLRLGSILLASTDPDRLRAWYLAAFGLEADEGGFLDLGGVDVLIDHRDDISPSNPQPGRVIINLHVDDAHTLFMHIDTLGTTWLAQLEERDDGRFATLIDPDGNYIQIIELNTQYYAARAQRAVADE